MQVRSSSACNFVPAHGRRPQCQFAPVLCVLPTTWPLPVAATAVLATWAQHCDRLVLTVRAEQLEVPMFGKLAAGLHVDVLPSHNHSVLSGRRPLAYCSGMDIWYDVREAIRVAAEQCPIHAFEWLLVSETDVYVSMPRVKEFLLGKAPDEARVFAHCKSYEKYWHGDSGGLALYSRRAVQQHLPILGSCQALDGRSKFATHVDRLRKAAGLVKPTVTTRCGASDKSIGVCMFLANVSCEAPTDEYNRGLIAEPENDAEHDNVSQGLAFNVGYNSILPMAIHDKKVLKLPGMIERLSQSRLGRHHHSDALSPLLLGPPWHLRHGVPAPPLPSVADLAATVGTLPRAARVMDPFHARVSMPHQGVDVFHGADDGTVVIDRDSCLKIKPTRDLCLGVFNATPAGRAADARPVRIFVRITHHGGTMHADLEQAALIENAVQQRLVRLQQHSLLGTWTEATELRRRGWTTRLTPRVSFVLLLRRTPSHGVGGAADVFLGPSHPSVAQQYITIAEVAPGRQLGSALTGAPAHFSLCAVLHATLQIALKIALLQRLTSFVHGDLMGNNVLCAPPVGRDGAGLSPSGSGGGASHLIGDCSFIDMESSTLSVPKRGRAGADASMLLGRTLDETKAYFAREAGSTGTALLTGAARAFDLHMFFYWLRRQAHALVAGPQSESRSGGGAVLDWLESYHARACNVSSQQFHRLPRHVSGASKYAHFGSQLHSCFWPERVAAEIRRGDELAMCDGNSRLPGKIRVG